MKIRKDRYGLYIRGRFYSIDKKDIPYRPGTFPGHSHAWDTSDAGLKADDNPKSAHVNGAPFVRITMPDGSKVYWGSYGRTEGDFAEDAQ